ncbi:hypothetical protein SLS56_010788 [Neofusicoccum ribis]|uniref:Uncharacterized protein n=1 Tax=Neofusicoccum ribis TaxID=45134 RepID=A0ABR3SF27_9PEZI
MNWLQTRASVIKYLATPQPRIQPFEKEIDQQEHLRATELCVVRRIAERDYGDGYDAEQAERLKPRKRKQRQEDKWQDIYKILFPHDHRRPSPCMHPRFCQLQVETTADRLTDCHDKLEDYRNFVRDGLSRVLCERLGGSSGDISSSLGHAGNLNLEDFMQDVYEQLFGEFQALYEDEDGGLSRSMTSTPASTCPPTPGSVMDDPPSPMEEDAPARPQKRKRSDTAEPETTTPTTVDTVGDSMHNAIATQAEHVQPPIDIVVSSDSTPLQMADEAMEETSYYGFPDVNDNYSDIAMSYLDGSPAATLHYTQDQPNYDFSQHGGGTGDFDFSFGHF